MNINIFSLAGPAGAWPVFSDPDESRSIQANPVQSSPHVTPHLGESINMESLTKKKPLPLLLCLTCTYLCDLKKREPVHVHG